jgi:hypothetical protein
MQTKIRQASHSSRIGGGAVPLATALSYATGVAAELRDRQTNIRPGTLPRDRSFRQNGENSDLAAFGAMLYELIAGSKPPRDLSNVLLPRVPQAGPDRVRASATRLALQCLGVEGHTPADMQQVLTEMRLYSLMARQNSYQQRARSGQQALPSPQFENSSSTLPESGIRASRHESNAVFQPKRQSQTLADADFSPRLAASPYPGWFALPPDPPEWQLLPDVRCPLCGGTYVHRSRARTPFEHLLVASGILLKRCHRCLHRYVEIMGIVFPKRTR